MGAASHRRHPYVVGAERKPHDARVISPDPGGVLP